MSYGLGTWYGAYAYGLVPTEAGGGTTHEVSITLSAATTAALTKIATLEAAQADTLDTSLTDAGNAILETAIAEAIAATLAQSANISIEAGLTLNTGATVSDTRTADMAAAHTLSGAVTTSFDPSLIYGVAVTLQGLATLTPSASGGVVSASINVNALAAVQPVVGLDQQVAIALSTLASVTPASMITIEGAVAIQTAATMAADALGVYEGAFTAQALATAVGEAIATLNANLSLNHEVQITQVGGGNVDAAFTISATAELTASGVIGVVEIQLPGARKVSIATNGRIATIGVNSRIKNVIH